MYIHYGFVPILSIMQESPCHHRFTGDNSASREEKLRGRKFLPFAKLDKSAVGHTKAFVRFNEPFFSPY